MIRAALPGFATAAVVSFVLSCGGEAPPGATGRDPEVPEAPAARLATVEFDVEGMTCAGCAIATEISVRKLAGVASVDASYDDGTGAGRCVVQHDPAVVSTDEIVEAIRDAGFEPTLRTAER